MLQEAKRIHKETEPRRAQCIITILKREQWTHTLTIFDNISLSLSRSLATFGVKVEFALQKRLVDALWGEKKTTNATRIWKMKKKPEGSSAT